MFPKIAIAQYNHCEEANERYLDKNKWSKTFVEYGNSKPDPFVYFGNSLN